MAGLIEALTNTYDVLDTIHKSKDGTAKAIVTALRGKRSALVRANGSMLSLLGNYIVEPVIVVSNDLKSLEDIDDIIGLHVDMFTGFYMQAFEVMIQLNGINASTAIDALATDNGGVSRALLSGASRAVEEETDYLGDLLNGDISISVETIDSGDVRALEDYKLENKKAEMRYKKMLENGVDEKGNVLSNYKRKQIEENYRAALKNGTDANGRPFTDAHIAERLSEVREMYKSKYTDRDGARSELGNGAKELYIPNAIERFVNLTFYSAEAKLYLKVPIIIKANILFTDIKTITNAMEYKNDKNSFTSRLDEYRSGAIALRDMIFASDLIKKYKDNKFKDTDKLMSIIHTRAISANSKAIDNSAVGFEKFYNMYIVTKEDAMRIEHEAGGKLKNYKKKEDALNALYGLSLSVVDTDYERIKMHYKDLKSTTDVSFKNVGRVEKKGVDHGELTKMLLAGRAPSF